MAAVIIVLRKMNPKPEVYTSIKGFCEHNKEYSVNKLYRCGFNKTSMFEDDNMVLHRIPIIGRIKKRQIPLLK